MPKFFTVEMGGVRLLAIDNGDGTATLMTLAFPLSPAVGLNPSAGSAWDAFQRLRVSNPEALFDSQFRYNTSTLLWDQLTSGGGAITHLPNMSAVQLSCGTASGDKAIRQTRSYFRYQPGKSQLIAMTGILGVGKTNVRKRVGYFDDGNGIFFEQNGLVLNVIQRSSTSGSPVDTLVAQSDWNLDKLDGTGISGTILDATKNQVFIIDFQWLGAGRVRIGFSMDGVIVYCHQFLNSNSLTVPYMATGNLPVRYEIVNTGVAASSTNLIQVCVSVVSEGGINDVPGVTFSANNGISSITVTTRRPILSIRPKLLFNSIVNRMELVPEDMEVMAASGVALWELVYSGTLTGAAFNSVDARSGVEFDVAASAISGGTVLDSGYVPSGSPTTRAGTRRRLISKVPFSLDLLGTAADILSIVCTSFTGSCLLNGEIAWKERR